MPRLFFFFCLVTGCCAALPARLAAQSGARALLRLQANPADASGMESAFRYGISLYQNGKLDSVRLAAETFRSAAKRMPGQIAGIAIGHAHCLEGMQLLAKGATTNAQTSLQYALAQYEEAASYKHLFVAYTAYSMVFSLMHQDSMTNACNRKALLAATMARDSSSMRKAWNNIAVWFVETQDRNDSALYYYQKVLRGIEAVKNHENLRVQSISTLSNIANLYKIEGKASEALAYAQKASSLLDSTATQYQRASTLITLADCYTSDGQPRKALAVYEQAFPLIQDSAFIHVRAVAYARLVEAYRSLGMNDSAYNAYSHYLNLRTEILRAESKKEFAQLSVKYEVAKKERENLELAAEAQAQRLLFGGISVCVALVIFFFWYRNRLKSQLLAQRHQAEVLKRTASEEKAYAAQMELENERLQKAAIENELYHAGLLVVSKNKTLLQLRDLLHESHGNNAKELRNYVSRLIEDIEKDIQSDGENTDLLARAASGEDDFIGKMHSRHPNLTKNDLRLCSYIKLGFSSAEIATFFNISESSVEMRRSRVRAKLNVPENARFKTFLVEVTAEA